MNIDTSSSFKYSTETIVKDDKSSECQHLMNQLEQLKNFSTTTNESKKQVWLQFISLWREILHFTPSEVQSCYNECARLLPIIMKSTNFFTIRRELEVARQNFYACITQLKQSRIKNYLILTVEEQELPEHCVYHTHVYYLLLIASQTALFIPFSAIEEQKFIENNNEIFTLFIESVERSMPDHSEAIIAKEYTLGAINERILTLLWNLADRTVLIPIFLKCDLAKQVIVWLTQAAKLTDKSRRPLISIIHNISRHDEGADELNKYGAIDVIKQYQNA